MTDVSKPPEYANTIFMLNPRICSARFSLKGANREY